MSEKDKRELELDSREKSEAIGEMDVSHKIDFEKSLSRINVRWYNNPKLDLLLPREFIARQGSFILCVSTDLFVIPLNINLMDGDIHRLNV